MPFLLVATTNLGKVGEIQALLGDSGWELVLPVDIGLILDVVEDGRTYAENAALKARAYAQAGGLVALGDDSGLEVDALDGAPGLHSARYAPFPGARDAERRVLLLRNLQPKPRPWLARFRCAVAVATPQGDLRLAEGVCEGEIIPHERGSNGFGYDPIFLLPELGRTMAELRMEEKNRLSHRARAILAARPILDEFLHNINIKG